AYRSRSRSTVRECCTLMPPGVRRAASSPRSANATSPGSARYMPVSVSPMKNRPVPGSTAMPACASMTARCPLAKNDHPELAGGGCHGEDDLHGVVVHALHLGLDIVLVAVRAVDAHENVLGAEAMRDVELRVDAVAYRLGVLADGAAAPGEQFVDGALHVGGAGAGGGVVVGDVLGFERDRAGLTVDRGDLVGVVNLLPRRAVVDDPVANLPVSLAVEVRGPGDGDDVVVALRAHAR